MGIFFGSKYITCSKHNYTGINNPCPDCYQEKVLSDTYVDSIFRAILDDIEFGYDVEMLKSKIINKSYGALSQK